MQVIVLAAGKSSRLAPLADKNLLEFSGKALIEHQIAALKRVKLRDIVVVASKNNLEQMERLLQSYKNVAVVEQKDLDEGMKGGVMAASKLVKHPNIMVLNGNDVFEDELFEKVIKASKEKGVHGVIAGKKMMDYFPGGYLKFTKSGAITDIIEKPGVGKEPSKLVNLVCHVYNDFPTFLKYLKNVKSKRDDKYEVAIDNYIKKGGAKIMAQKYTGTWSTLKYPWHVLQMMNHFLEGQETKISRQADIAKSAIIEGNVFIEKNVRVLPNAVIKGPAYIGEGSIIANNALVRDSMIGRNCVVGYSTEVARSYLNHDVWMHSNYIGDSVIDSNVSFGAGTVLGNLRFDEASIMMKIKKDKVDTDMNKLGAIIGSGSRFGINSSTNPGVRIGRNCFIGGNVLIEKDVEDDKMVLLDQKLKVIKNTQSISIENRNEMKGKVK